jgi:hypothetical protein
MRSLLVAATLLAPAVVALHTLPAYAEGPSSSATAVHGSAAASTSSGSITLTSSGDFPEATSRFSSSNLAVQAHTPDLLVRIMDQAGAHDPTATPPPGPQDIIAAGQSQDFVIQVRNAGGGSASGVAFDFYATGLLNPVSALSTGDGFSCAVNSPDGHFVRCTGGSIAPGGWGSAASVTIRVTAEQPGTGVVVATANPGHSVSESDYDNNQDARWVTVTSSVSH